MKVSIYSAKGVKTEKKIELPEDIFGVKPNLTVLRQYIHVYRNIQRAGTVATKTRGEVSGGGSKPWAQKGRGRAGATVELVGNLNPYEVLNSGDLVFFQESIGKLKERLTEKRKTVKVVKAIKPVKVVKKTVGPKRKTKSKKR